MDSLFADPMIFKVAKNLIDSFGGVASCEVLDVFTHHTLSDVLFNLIPYDAGGELEVCHAYLTFVLCLLVAFF